MSINLTNIPYSVLDLAVVTKGSSTAQAIQQSRDLAQHAEEQGYHRFWMAEHHNMKHIASSATTVLLGHVAEATTSIRVGSGGIMLPNHSPLVIAEQFGTLATMYPNRIDLGLGRAPGTDQATAHAIRPDRIQQVHNFPENVKQLRKYLSAENDSNVRAFPGEGTEVPLWILGSSTDSAHLAAELGLPYAFASHFAPQQLHEAIRIYRENFKPSKQLDEPYIMAGINMIAANSNEIAEYLSTSMKQMFLGIITGEREPLPPPVDDLSTIMGIQYKMALNQMLAYSFIGDPIKIENELQAFIKQTEVNEVLIASYIFDYEERLKSHQLFAEMMKGLISKEASPLHS